MATVTLQLSQKRDDNLDIFTCSETLEYGLFQTLNSRMITNSAPMGARSMHRRNLHQSSKHRWRRAHDTDDDTCTFGAGMGRSNSAETLDTENRSWIALHSAEAAGLDIHKWLKWCVGRTFQYLSCEQLCRINLVLLVTVEASSKLMRSTSRRYMKL